MMDSDYIFYAGNVGIAAEAAVPEESREILEMINRKVAGGQSLDGIMDFLFENLTCPCDRLGLSFLEDDGKRVVAHWARARNERIFLKKGFWQALAGSSLERIISTGQIRIINDLERYSAEHPSSASTRLVLKEGVMSSMTCPLNIDGRPVGFLFRSSYRKNAYNRTHIAMHSMVAERIGQAVEKAYRIEQLTETNRAYTEMLAFVSHEIKNPLSSIIMDAGLLLKGYIGELQPDQAEKIRKLETKAKFLLELTKDYLNLARIEGGKLEPDMKTGVELKELIEDGIAVLEPQIQARKCRLTCEFRGDGSTLDCDPDLLRIVIINLVGNAVKYGNEGGEVRITCVNDGKDLCVSVWNEGPGFSEDDKERLFRKFSRLKREELMRQKGSGVGLYTVWQIISAHDGRVSADSELGRWAEFKFSIPLGLLRGSLPHKL